MPLSFARPVCDLLIGIDTIRNKWCNALGQDCHHLGAAYLGPAEPFEENNLLINGGCVPTEGLVDEILALGKNEIQTFRGEFIAMKASLAEAVEVLASIEKDEKIIDDELGKKVVETEFEPIFIEKPSDIFANNGDVLKNDFARITKGKYTTNFEEDIRTKGEQIFIHPTAVVSHCILNASNGPIYIGEHAEIMEGSIIRGPFCLGEHSTVKMGAKIYGDTSVGRHCKVGGEIGNSVIHDYSNKGHDGYLGNSVLGSWCNLGADTNTSNLMNTYGEVKVWNYKTEKISPTGRQFHGLIMGDHSKSGINTMFNTGTVVGMCANIFGGGFPDKFIPSFSWGSPERGFSEFRMDKAIETAEAMMSRRGIKFGQADKDVFNFAKEHDRKYRK